MTDTNWILNYATLRFMPHRQTAEFVNVGVVASCPQIDFFDFKLTGNSARVHAFFPELDLAVFSATLESMNADLLHRRKKGIPMGIQPLSHAAAVDKLQEFQTLVRRRESILHFSEPRTLITGDPQTAVQNLYEQLVERSFSRIGPELVSPIQ